MEEEDDDGKDMGVPIPPGFTTPSRPSIGPSGVPTTPYGTPLGTKQHLEELKLQERELRSGITPEALSKLRDRLRGPREPSSATPARTRSQASKFVALSPQAQSFLDSAAARRQAIDPDEEGFGLRAFTGRRLAGMVARHRARMARNDLAQQIHAGEIQAGNNNPRLLHSAYHPRFKHRA